MHFLLRAATSQKRQDLHYTINTTAFTFNSVKRKQPSGNKQFKWQFNFFPQIFYLKSILKVKPRVLLLAIIFSNTKIFVLAAKGGALKTCFLPRITSFPSRNLYHKAKTTVLWSEFNLCPCDVITVKVLVHKGGHDSVTLPVPKEHFFL